MDTMWKIGEQLLRWGTLAYCSVFPAVSHSYNRYTYPCPVEQKYHENGPYQVTVHSIDGIHVFLPDTVHKAPLPTVVMVNGTGLKVPIRPNLSSGSIQKESLSMKDQISLLSNNLKNTCVIRISGYICKYLKE